MQNIKIRKHKQTHLTYRPLAETMDTNLRSSFPSFKPVQEVPSFLIFGAK